MKRIPIGDLVRPVLSTSPAAMFSDSFTYIDISSVNRETKQLENEQVLRVTDAPSRARQVVENGDVLVSTVRPNLNAVACVKGHLTQAIASTGFCVLRPYPDRLDASYLFRWVQTPQFIGEMTRRSTGASYPAVSDNIVKSSSIPLPPLEEQKRIAAILDKAYVIRRKREQAMKLAGEFLRSLFLDMFGDPVRNPKGWPRSTFDDQLSFMQYGPRFYDEPYTPTGIRTVRITDLDSSGLLAFEDMPRIEASREVIDTFRLKTDDLIFARSGATVGKVALIPKGAPPCIAGAYFLRMRFSQFVLPQYARMILASDSIQAIIVGQSRQSAQQNFSGPALRRLPIPIPPLNLQERFVMLERTALNLKQTYGRQLMESASLKCTLAHRAFRGEL